MQITELKQQIEAGKIIEELLEVKSYLPLVEKQLIVNKIIDSCIIVDENGLSKIDFFYKYLTTQISLIVNYTSLEFSENIIEDFDYLAEYIGIEWIIDKISPIEVCIIQELVDDELDQVVKINNSIESIAQKGINDLKVIIEEGITKIVEKLPNDKQIKSLSKSLIKDVNKLNWDKVPMIKQMWETANGKNDK